MFPGFGITAIVVVSWRAGGEWGDEVDECTDGGVCI